jgi:heat shock protein HslJ
MRRTTALVLPTLGALLLAACNAAASASPSASAAGAGAGSPAAGGSAAAGGPELVGTAWALGDFPGQVLADVRPTVAFSGDGTVTGSGGCNDFNGTYTVDGSKLTFGPLASTKKACAEAVNTLETAYLTALQATTAYEITSDSKLKLTGPTATLTYAVQQ